MKVCVEHEVCIGCGLCVSLCPEVFTMGDSGKSEVKVDDISGQKAAVEDCVNACPVGAIKIQGKEE